MKCYLLLIAAMLYTASVSAMDNDNPSGNAPPLSGKSDTYIQKEAPSTFDISHVKKSHLFADSYDDLAKEISVGVSRLLNKKIAVLPLVYIGNIGSVASEIVAERLITKIVQLGNVQVIERNLIEKVLQEKQLSLTGIVNEDVGKEVGKILGVGAIVTGTINDIGDREAEVNVRLISSNDGRVLVALSRNVEKTWKKTAPDLQPNTQPHLDRSEDVSRGSEIRVWPDFLIGGVLLLTGTVFELQRSAADATSKDSAKKATDQINAWQVDLAQANYWKGVADVNLFFFGNTAITSSYYNKSASYFNSSQAELAQGATYANDAADNRDKANLYKGISLTSFGIGSFFIVKGVVKYFIRTNYKNSLVKNVNEHTWTRKFTLVPTKDLNGAQLLWAYKF